MTPRFSHADWFRARLIVLSDRRPAPGAARTEMEAAIEAALHEHDGVWLGRHTPEADGVEVGASAEVAAEIDAGADADAGAGDLEGWSVLDEAAVRPGGAMEAWARYARANTAYAERIVESVSSDGVVWINGSRWLLVAPALRQLGHRGPIGLVLDVPFPAPVRLEALPWHIDVMAALCQLDLDRAPRAHVRRALRRVPRAHRPAAAPAGRGLPRRGRHAEPRRTLELGGALPPAADWRIAPHPARALTA